jgi:hypothetical protein
MCAAWAQLQAGQVLSGQLCVARPVGGGANVVVVHMAKAKALAKAAAKANLRRLHHMA